MVLFCKITERPKFSELIIIIIKGVIFFVVFQILLFTSYSGSNFKLPNFSLSFQFWILPPSVFFLFSLSFFTRSLSVKNSQSVSESR